MSRDSLFDRMEARWCPGCNNLGWRVNERGWDQKITGTKLMETARACPTCSTMYEAMKHFSVDIGDFHQNGEVRFPYTYQNPMIVQFRTSLKYLPRAPFLKELEFYTLGPTTCESFF